MSPILESPLYRIPMLDRVTHCSECGKPWGVILEDRGKPTEANKPTRDESEVRRAEMIQVLLEEVWEPDFEPEELAAVDKDLLPSARVEQVVWITEATAAFASEHLWGDWGLEGGLWYPAKDVDFPAWLVKGRKHRWCVKWDCCNLGHPSAYAPKETARV